uniref:Uncharacterized protein n=1 Tax=Providencia stuartii TaxID=588 RepID=A0AAI9HWS0_PROST|nr:hypothetical protein [Providencia stuartii]
MPPIAKQWGNLIDIEILIATTSNQQPATSNQQPSTINHQPSTIKRTVIVI